MKAFTLTIALRMVKSGTRLLSSIKDTKLLYQRTLKVLTLVRMQTCRDPKFVKPVTH